MEAAGKPAKHPRDAADRSVVVLAVEWQDSTRCVLPVPPVCHLSRNATPCMTHAAGPVWFAVAA